MPVQELHESGAQEARKKERMGQAAVAPEIAVTNTEGQADDVEIRDNRAGHAKKQDLPGHDRMAGRLSEYQGHERVGKCRRHQEACRMMNSR